MAKKPKHHDEPDDEPWMEEEKPVWAHEAPADEEAHAADAAAHHDWKKGLVGLGFDVFGEGGTVAYSGIIRAMIGDNYVVQYTSSTDPRDRLAVVPINKILQPAGDRHGPGAWSLYIV